MSTEVGVNTPVQQSFVNTAEVKTKDSWMNRLAKGATTLVSTAVGLQASAIVSAWAPKIILDRAIAGSSCWAWGALVTGPAAVKASAPIITLMTAGAGVAATAGTAATIVCAGKILSYGVNAIKGKLEERRIRESERLAQNILANNFKEVIAA